MSPIHAPDTFSRGTDQGRPGTLTTACTATAPKVRDEATWSARLLWVAAGIFWTVSPHRSPGLEVGNMHVCLRESVKPTLDLALGVRVGVACVAQLQQFRWECYNSRALLTALPS